MFLNKLICLIVIFISLIYINQAKPYGGYGYGFPSSNLGYGRFGGFPGHATKPYGTAYGQNIGYGFANPMGYQEGIMSGGYGSNLNKHKGYLGNSLFNSYGYGSPYNRYGYGNGILGFFG